LATGRARFSSRITHESGDFGFAVLHLGDHNLLGGVRPADPEKDKEEGAKLKGLFSHADTAEIIRDFDADFNKQTFTLKSLFHDEQRKITRLILNESIHATAGAYRSIYETNAPFIHFLRGLNIPVPRPLMFAAQVALNSQLREAIEQSDPDLERIRGFLREAADSRVEIDTTTLEFAVRRKLESEAAKFAGNPDSPENAHQFKKLLDMAFAMPFPVVLAEVQNISYAPLVKALDSCRAAKAESEPARKTFLSDLCSLREGLRIQGTLETPDAPDKLAMSHAAS
jgi:Domain of unknown function (DUF3536)